MSSAAGTTTLDVELQTRARFGKPDGRRDYSWLSGEEALTPLLLSICEPLARAAANASTCIALVAEAGGRVWLVRAYSSGVDNAFRPIAALDVAEVLAPYPLPLAHWLGLAAVSIQQPERIGVSNIFSISVPPPLNDPLEPDPALAVRARLGLPLTTSSRVALSLLNPELWRYRGVCYAARSKGATPAEWSPEFAPFLCVNFAEPVLTAEDAEALEFASRRLISADEWEQLRGLDRDQLLQALRWAASGGGPLPESLSGDSAMHWLVAYRAAQYRGSGLLARLQRDLDSKSLPHAVVRAAARDLSDRAVDFIHDAAAGRAPTASLDLVAELVGRGYLGNEDVVPLHLWVRLSAQSPEVTDEALRRFVSLGVGETAARFVLDLDPAVEPRPMLDLSELLKAAQLAVGMSIPPPKGRLLKVLATAYEPAQLHWLLEVGGVYGGWAEALMRLADKGSTPPPGVLTAEEALTAVRARSGVLGERDSLTKLLLCLLDEGRASEAEELFRAGDQLKLIPLNAGGRQVLASRLGLMPPSAPPPLNELAELARTELARPEDILLGDEHAPDLRYYAILWPNTSPLAAVLDEAGRGEAPASIPALPGSWTAAARRALTPRLVGRWLERLAPAQREEGRRWVAQLRGLDSRLMQGLCGESAASLDRREVESNLVWLAALLMTVERPRKLRGIGSLSLGGAALGDEPFAAMLVSLLLPSADIHAREFALYTLSRVGPLPPAAGLPADLTLALLPALDVGGLIDAVFVSQDTGLSGDPDVCQALAARARAAGVKCPPGRYTATQLRRHLPLADALASVPGWEPLAPGAEARVDYLLRLMRQLGVSRDELVGACPERESEPEPPATLTEESL